MSDRQGLAAEFRRLHGDGLLLLPNVWDGGSARLIESLGAKALATTSAGVAWAHGCADGDRLPVPLLMQSVATIVRVARVPVSVDVEGGYTDAPAEVAELVARLADAGAVGLNIEDGIGAPELLCAKIEAAKRAAGSSVFVNARTDVYVRGLVPAERRVTEALARATRYRAAGADGLFVPGVIDAADIRELVPGAGLPLNVLARPGLPPAATLAELGVRRLSAGSWVASAAFGRLRSVVTTFLDDGVCDPLFENSWPYAEIQALFVDR
jgi:2-methylisocitrate lyase-like PEP mutase family enzyme